MSLAVSHRLGETFVLLILPSEVVWGFDGFNLSIIEAVMVGFIAGDLGTMLTSVDVEVDTETASSMILIEFSFGKKDSGLLMFDVIMLHLFSLEVVLIVDVDVVVVVVVVVVVLAVVTFVLVLIGK